jgi:sterol desaturase/sphingolipid hydroxylase (fatty acid hydroxylase superfamily)
MRGELIELIQVIAGFALMGLFCTWLERLWPEKPKQPAWRSDSLLDLGYMGLRVLLSGLLVVMTGVAGYKVMPHRQYSLVSMQPLWLQAIEFLLLGDFVSYWVHRYMHFHPFLWRIHSVHHSAEQIDWLVAARDHPLELALQKLSSSIVLYPFGFSPTLFAAYVPFVATYSLLIHSNLTWSYGTIGYFITSPAFHRWHHSSDAEAIDKNFAQTFAVFDYLFGTAYCPPRQLPIRYGLVGKQLSANMWSQLLYPFQRPKAPLVQHSTQLRGESPSDGADEIFPKAVDGYDNSSGLSFSVDEHDALDQVL